MRDLVLDQVTAALIGSPWAIQPDKLQLLVEALTRRRSGVSISADDMERFRQLHADRERVAHPGANVREVRGIPVRQYGRVAVVPLSGTISQRPGLFTRYSGGTSAEQFAAVHEELLADSSVSAVVWDVDSPGGSVAGVPEAFDRLYAQRGRKPTVALSNSLMASAAYWLAAAADSISVSPSSLTGSIGVYTAHEDHSRANDRAGVSVTYVYAGRKKIDGNSDTPLSDPARESMQQMVDDYYGQFTAAVAKGRNSTPAGVRNGFGEGDVLTANRAVSARLADRVETLPAVLARLGAARGSGRQSSAAAGMSPQLAQAIQRQARAAALS